MGAAMELLDLAGADTDRPRVPGSRGSPAAGRRGSADPREYPALAGCRSIYVVRLVPAAALDPARHESKRIRLRSSDIVGTHQSDGRERGEVFNGDCYHVVFPSVGGTESGLIRDDRAILEGAGDAIVIISPVQPSVPPVMCTQGAHRWRASCESEPKQNPHAKPSNLLK